MFTNFDNIDFDNPKDLNNFWNAMERGFEGVDNMSALHTDYPINNREEFADYFTNIAEFLHYVRKEYTHEQTHKYPVDKSWRYVAMDWFDTICGSSIWEM